MSLVRREIQHWRFITSEASPQTGKDLPCKNLTCSQRILGFKDSSRESGIVHELIVVAEAQKKPGAEGLNEEHRRYGRLRCPDAPAAFRLRPSGAPMALPMRLSDAAVRCASGAPVRQRRKSR